MKTGNHNVLINLVYLRNGLICLSFIWAIAVRGIAQDFKIPKQQIPVINEGFRTLVEIYDGEKKVKNPDNSRYYFWLKAKEIHFSKGGYEGDLLHGEYTVFFPSENLKEKGTFKMGLKVGTWKEWYDNGELKEISRWKDGLLSGEVLKYSDSGKLISRNQYNKGLLDGRQYYYTDSLITQKKFNNGREKIPKSRKATKKNEKLKNENPADAEENANEPVKEKKKRKFFRKKEKKTKADDAGKNKKQKKSDNTEKV